MGAAKPPDPAVLVVGGGPIGLALAAELGRRGVGTLLVDAGPEPLGDQQPGDAKMIQVSVRTMEFCRQLGVGDQVRDWGFPAGHGLDSVFVTTLTGYELGRVRTPTLAEAPDSLASPERDRPCPQTWFDPILRRFARDTGNVTFRYRTRLVSFAQDSDGVTASVEDVGGRRTLRTAYLVGCDGASSTVRSLLGVEVRGERHLDRSMSVYVTIPGLDLLHDKGSAYRYVMVGPAGTWAVLTTIDGRDLYRLQLIGIDLSGQGEDEIIRVLHRCVGAGVRCAIEGISAWERKMTVADRFSDGRVFLAGDAAHAHPPNGGLGMNTGIPDAWDLGWKLAAVLQGWAGETMLDSYDIERRPICHRAAQESLRDYRRLVDSSGDAHLLEDTPAGARARELLGRRLVAENERSWHPVGIHLGYLTFPSPVVVDDGSPVAEDDTFRYVPSARPGARAPHVWLEAGRSTLDLFGPGFTLLDFGGQGADRLAEAARRRNVPLRLCRIANDPAASLYERRFVLVRPDGHVAWRADAVPATAESLGIIDTVRGAGPRIAARRSPAGLPPGEFAGSRQPA
jgi:2-polyprenyl-6-methoxyphenol hydroxylase-like FAD-dependent oxidoreductase